MPPSSPYPSPLVPHPLLPPEGIRMFRRSLLASLSGLLLASLPVSAQYGPIYSGRQPGCATPGLPPGAVVLPPGTVVTPGTPPTGTPGGPPLSTDPSSPSPLLDGGAMAGAGSAV